MIFDDSKSKRQAFVGTMGIIRFEVEDIKELVSIKTVEYGLQAVLKASTYR
jgi:hypothetical protein